MSDMVVVPYMKLKVFKSCNCISSEKEGNYENGTKDIDKQNQ